MPGFEIKGYTQKQVVHSIRKDRFNQEVEIKRIQYGFVCEMVVNQIFFKTVKILKIKSNITLLIYQVILLKNYLVELRLPH